MLVGFYKYLLFPLGLAGGCVPEAYGQTPQDSLYHIREVVVTGRVVRREVIPVQELSGERLQRLNSHNVADALRYFSGIQIKDYGGVGGLKTVNIRSMGTNHVGVFYDGIELGNAQNGTVDLGRFSLDNMESVTLYNGNEKCAVEFPPTGTFAPDGKYDLQRFDPQGIFGRRGNSRTDANHRGPTPLVAIQDRLRGQRGQ